MCDYCDCRSHPEIAALSNDHEQMSSLLGRIRTAVGAGDRGAADRAVTAVHDLLHGHATREELGVFAELRTQVDGSYVDMFEQDHATLHDLLDRTTGEDWAPAASALANELGGHILREESDLFPAAHQLLTPDQWAHIADRQRLATRRSS